MIFEWCMDYLIADVANSKRHQRLNKILIISTCTIVSFHVTSYQANFASHPTRDRHVGFLLHGRV